jgi:ABC-type transport system substrate-binding protein
MSAMTTLHRGRRAATLAAAALALILSACGSSSSTAATTTSAPSTTVADTVAATTTTTRPTTAAPTTATPTTAAGPVADCSTAAVDADLATVLPDTFVNQSLSACKGGYALVLFSADQSGCNSGGSCPDPVPYYLESVSGHWTVLTSDRGFTCGTDPASYPEQIADACTALAG